MSSEAQRDYNQRLEQKFQECIQSEKDPRLVRLPGEGIDPPMEVIHILGINVMDTPFYQVRLLLHDKIQPIAFEYEGNSIPLEHSGHIVHELADCWKEGYMRDRHNISPKENWAESIVHKQWDMVYWNSIFGVDDIQLEAIPRIDSTFHLLPKDLHISWYLCKLSKDIYHNAKQVQEEAESFISNKISKPIVTPAILKCAARDIIQAIDPHEEFLLSSEHISYCVQVIAVENYLDHPAPVYQEQPPQDSSAVACARHKGPPQTPGPDYA